MGAKKLRTLSLLVKRKQFLLLTTVFWFLGPLAIFPNPTYLAPNFWQFFCLKYRQLFPTYDRRCMRCSKQLELVRVFSYVADRVLVVKGDDDAVV